MNMIQNSKYESHLLIPFPSFQFCVWILLPGTQRKMFIYPRKVIIGIPVNEVSDHRCMLAEQTSKDLKKNAVK